MGTRQSSVRRGRPAQGRRLAEISVDGREFADFPGVAALPGYRLIESSSPPSAFMVGRVSGAGARHRIRPELWPTDGGPCAGWLITTRDGPLVPAIVLVRVADSPSAAATIEPDATRLPGTSQIEPTWVWVVTVEPTAGGQPGMVAGVP